MSETAHLWRARVVANGHDGYGCYRIPGIVRLGNGDLLARCEGRADNCGDHGGVIPVVARTSRHNGGTWVPLFEVATNVLPKGSEHVAQKPSLAVDLVVLADVRNGLLYEPGATGGIDFVTFGHDWPMGNADRH